MIITFLLFNLQTEFNYNLEKFCLRGLLQRKAGWGFLGVTNCDAQKKQFILGSKFDEVNKLSWQAEQYLQWCVKIKIASMNMILAALLSLVMVTSAPKDYYSFTLRNNSAKSIPLSIPTVMNPNLSPFSNSGVSLKEGQEIFFFENKKKYLLLTVTPDLEGDTLYVNELIKTRKVELNLDK